MWNLKKRTYILRTPISMFNTKYFPFQPYSLWLYLYSLSAFLIPYLFVPLSPTLLLRYLFYHFTLFPFSSSPLHSPFLFNPLLFTLSLSPSLSFHLTLTHAHILSPPFILLASNHLKKHTSKKQNLLVNNLLYSITQHLFH